MKSIAVVIPWFGKLPPTYTMWRTSVLYNRTIDFYLYTDVECASEGNLRVVHTTFEKFKGMLQRQFDFTIACARPYKLCDYKPVYGMVLHKLLAQYDFWGYCDMDMVFGDIRSFLTDAVLSQNERIFYDGHLSLFKNDERMNSLYMLEGEWPEYNYEEAFTTDDACYFDEYRGMELKCIRASVRCYSDGTMRCNFDPKLPKYYKGGKQVIAHWKQGRLYTVSQDGETREMVYVHIAKRSFVNQIGPEAEDFVVLPGLICEADGMRFNKYYQMGGVNYTNINGWLSA